MLPCWEFVDMRLLRNSSFASLCWLAVKVLVVYLAMAGSVAPFIYQNF
jgi:hypothetical protein